MALRTFRGWPHCFHVIRIGFVLLLWFGVAKADIPCLPVARVFFPTTLAQFSCIDLVRVAPTSPIPPAAFSEPVSRIVIIDAGHGGHDAGTVGPHGLREKDAVLDIALRTGMLVRKVPGIEVVLTREDDRFVPLEERAAMANDRGADLFLSIHANSSPHPAASGPETFFLNFMNGMNDRKADSERFARTLQSAVFRQAAYQREDAPRDRGIKRAPFVVLAGASMPSALAEIGFLSNAQDELDLGTPEYRQKIAEALCRGVREYSASLAAK